MMAIGLNITFPDNIFMEGFLFVTEAALVGGIADWFAVTALFKKPLGFPFHTAILPRRRQNFIDASVLMVQKEFFSRRTILKKLDKVKLLPRLVDYLSQEKTRKLVIGELYKVIKKFVAAQDKEKLSETMANKLRKMIQDLPVQNFIGNFAEQIVRMGKDKEMFVGLMKALRKTAAKTESRQKLQSVLEEYAQEKTKNMGGFSILMAGLAQMLNLVNFEEAAQIMQTQLLKLLDELSNDTPLQRRTLDECRAKISEMAATPEFKDMIERIQIDAANNLPLEESITLAITHIENQILSVEFDESVNIGDTQAVTLFEKNFGIAIIKILNDEYSGLLRLLSEDTAAKFAVEKFINELVVRSALHAQPLIGNVAQSALEKLTEEQLNNLVYDKAEQDFIWIRLNGSIVGATVGLIIFVLLEIFSGVIA